MIRVLPSIRQFSRTFIRAVSGLTNITTEFFHSQVFLSSSAALFDHLKSGILP